MAAVSGFRLKFIKQIPCFYWAFAKCSKAAQHKHGKCYTSVLSPNPSSCIVAKPKYRIDLKTQMAECETNYARVMKLLPDLFEVDQFSLAIDQADGHALPVQVDVQERSKYTTVIEVSQQSRFPDWLPSPRFKVRIYHDVRMAEVIAYQRQHRLQARYDYPNDRMFQPDEKAQLNHFLGEWLSHCLRYGQARQASFC
jgi:uncharacterized protein YqiB (DUF1249 family)